MVMKKMKLQKIIAIAVGFMLALTVWGAQTSYAATLDNITLVEPTAASGVVTISGKHSSGAGKVVTIRVICEQSPGEDHVDQALTDSGGSFEFSYTLDLNDGQSGLYTVKLSGVGIGQAVVRQYTFINKTIGNVITAQINGATEVGNLNGSQEGTVVKIIEDNFFLFEQAGLEDENGFKAFSADDQVKVYAALLQRNFEDITAVVQGLRHAIAVECLNNGAADRVPAILTQYADIFHEMPVGENSDYFNLANKAPVHAALAGKNFALIDSAPVVEAFLKGIALEAIKEINGSNRGNLDDLIVKYSRYIGLTSAQVTEFQSLYNTTIMQGILDQQSSFSNLEAIKNAVLKAMEDYKDGLDEPGGSSSSGGPKKVISGGGGGVYVPPVETVNPQPGNTLLFSDISTVEWAVDSIQELAKKGIVVGTGEGLFGPSDSITREQFVKMLIKTFDIREEDASTRFKDLDQGQWYYPYIATAEKLNLVNGNTQDTFGIGKEITREEMAVMVYRFAQYAEIDFLKQKDEVQFSDGLEIGDYAGEAVSVLQQANIINGVEDNRFAPKDTLTRAMAAKVLYSVLQLHAAP